VIVELLDLPGTQPNKPQNFMLEVVAGDVEMEAPFVE
jgi:hypothetical protein